MVLMRIAFYAVTENYNIPFIFSVTGHDNVPLKNKMFFLSAEI